MDDYVFTLQRLKDNGVSTTGEFYFPGFTPVSMEDTGRDLNHDGDLSDTGEEKIYGQTRIPCGKYEIKLRTEGRLHEKWKRIFPFHRGMLHLQNVPDFSYVYIHPLTKAGESLGCIGPGMKKINDDRIYASRAAYTKMVVEHIHPAFDRGQRVFIDIKDENQ